MISHHTALWSWLLPVVLASPWIVGSIVFWRLRSQDGFVPPSHAQLLAARR